MLPVEVGVTGVEPLVGSGPDHAFEAVQEVALVLDQVSVVD
jgi:hypothetical protein